MRLVLTRAGYELDWQSWDEVFIVYQPSSAETHVFNETTALILRCLAQGPRTTEEVRAATEAALGVGPGELVAVDFEFATRRLEELGLIDGMNESIVIQ